LVDVVQKGKSASLQNRREPREVLTMCVNITSVHLVTAVFVERKVGAASRRTQGSRFRINCEGRNSRAEENFGQSESER